MNDAGDPVSIADLLDERRHLLDLAHGMLGSRCEAEDAIAETYRRWYELSSAARARITTPRAWLEEVVGSICCPARPNALDSMSTAVDIEGRTEPEHAEPADRALHSLRAMHSRPTTPQQRDAVVLTVRQACATEDAPLLASLLAPDAMAFYDGGGKVRAPTGPVRGNLEVARSLLTLIAPHPRITLHTHSVNGHTGIVVRYDHQVASVISLDIAGHQAVQIWATLNPDKLRSWNLSRTELLGDG
ncbi:RNA polymerase subunit sigma [Streptomyces phaeochromogenes]|uniref:RNA polymerase subunit sigma n=1 Tax=Streptomyces phaeochromogenes TaxID=1923 RepID=UPI0022586117|nr:RNA polymerase subunit sigma [Streptomyces phaeochromogenes]MCX5602584.1 RNA polymerase subunit sigma [Streptomyces phaeochromogenes]